MIRVPLPARHHQSRQTLEEADVSFLLEVVQHFLHKEPKQSEHGSSARRHLSSLKSYQTKCRLLFTCCTRMLPPFRMEMPSWRVTVTMAPSRPDDHSPCITRPSRPKRPLIKTQRSFEWVLPLLALIIWSTISAAPRSCSLACWYSIFCFSISFSCKRRRSAVPSSSQSLKDAEAGVGGGSFTSNVFSFPSSSTSSSPSAQLWKRTHDKGWPEVADEANTWRKVESEVPLPSYQHRRYTRDLPPKNWNNGKIINKVVNQHWSFLIACRRFFTVTLVQSYVTSRPV